MNSLAAKLQRTIKGEVKTAEPLKNYTTLRVGGPAAIMVWPCEEDDLAATLALIARQNLPWLILGNGSNLLVKDSGFPGVVIKMEHFAHLEFTGEEVYAQAGVMLPALIKAAKEKSLGGLEFLWGIPGTVGGAIKMNAGAAQKEISELLLEVKTMDFQGKTEIIPRKKLDFSYRYADINNRVVIGGKFLLRKLSLNDILNNLEKVKNLRQASQPLDKCSAGSIFKNPPGKYAGQLIEAAGLKGFRLGGAEISAKHANFIVTDKGAKASDVLDLMALAKERVFAQFQVELSEEVIIVG